MTLNKRNLSTEWYHKCDSDKARLDRKKLVEASTPILETLLKLTEDRRKTLSEVRENDYNVAAWAHLQAHRNGRLEELDRLCKLLGSAIDQ